MLLNFNIYFLPVHPSKHHTRRQLPASAASFEISFCFYFWCATVAHSAEYLEFGSSSLFMLMEWKAFGFKNSPATGWLNYDGEGIAVCATKCINNRNQFQAGLLGEMGKEIYIYELFEICGPRFLFIVLDSNELQVNVNMEALFAKEDCGWKSINNVIYDKWYYFFQ